jgi:hypothetical protein
LPGVGWGRPQDAGVVDLHFPPGRYPAYWPDDDMTRRHMTLTHFAGGAVFAPSPFLRARHALVHDQLKNGSWWLFSVNLRDLHDLHRLTTDHGVDWRALHDSMPDWLSRRALESQYLVVGALFGAPRAGRAPPVAAVSRVHANWRLREATLPLGRAARTLGRVGWWLRCGQVRWRTRQSTRHLLGRMALKLMKRA